MNGTEVMKDIFSRSTSLGEMLFDSMRDNIRFGVEQLNAKPKKLYDASFGEPKELLNELNTGFSISGKAQITKELSFMNSAIIGGTGTGKTSVNAICTCLNTQNASLIIHDPPGQLIDKVGADFVKRGFKVYVFDPSNPNGSISINPLDDIKDQQDINKIAAHWNKSSMGEGGSEKFWTLASINATRTEQRINIWLALSVFPTGDTGKISYLHDRCNVRLGERGLITIQAHVIVLNVHK